MQKLIRNQDQTIFWFMDQNHWSEIRSETGETDFVKFYGGEGPFELYVSHSKGFTYKYNPKNPNLEPTP